MELDITSIIIGISILFGISFLEPIADLNLSQIGGKSFGSQAFTQSNLVSSFFEMYGALRDHYIFITSNNVR